VKSAVEIFPHQPSSTDAPDNQRPGERMRQACPGDDPTVVSGARRPPTLQILPKPLFLEELRRERIRSDRSQAPLSLVILQLAPEPAFQGNDLNVVLRLLRAGLRESDSVSFLQHRELALLLPRTDETATQIVMDRIFRDNAGAIASIAGATYPDKLFQNLDLVEKQGLYIESTLWTSVPETKPIQSVLKRGLDIFGAVTGLLLLWPLLLAIMAAIKLTSPGPAVFSQIRLGKDFKPFTFYKFRSMFTNADDKIHRDYLASLIAGNPEAGDPDTDGTKFYKLKADSRVTPLGRFLRKTSLDELPQLFNVLRGDMSLVGPRPPIPYETGNYRAWHLRRISAVKPGLTGLWQVEGRSKTTFDEMVRMDIRYSCDWSILLDLKLLLRTIKVVVEGRGAA
jgi:lipopolysaccharide/colanic/teichoic acid biosynthesis glycosyltransferase